MTRHRCYSYDSLVFARRVLRATRFTSDAFRERRLYARRKVSEGGAPAPLAETSHPPRRVDADDAPDAASDAGTDLSPTVDGAAMELAFEKTPSLAFEKTPSLAANPSASFARSSPRRCPPPSRAFSIRAAAKKKSL